MDMVIHQTVNKDLYVFFFAESGDDLKKFLTVRIVEKNILAINAPKDYMIITCQTMLPRSSWNLIHLSLTG